MRKEEIQLCRSINTLLLNFVDSRIICSIELSEFWKVFGSKRYFGSRITETAAKMELKAGAKSNGEKFRQLNNS